MKVQLFSTKHGMKSASLKRLADALSNELGYKVFCTTTPQPNRRVFQYGGNEDKLQQYKWFKEHGLSALEFTTSHNQALVWQNEGSIVVGRKLLSASCGHGIVIGEEPGTDMPLCPVYTKYKPKKREFRVHIFKDIVVTIVEKKLRTGWANGPSKIRNLANGYVFCQTPDLEPAVRHRLSELALDASRVSSSDFKGVDIGYNEKKDNCFVIEVNSMPGIEGSNVDKYVQVMKLYV